MLFRSKREYRLRLTGSGRRLFRELEPLVLDYQKGLMDKLGETEARRLEQAITALETALDLAGEETG